MATAETSATEEACTAAKVAGNDAYATGNLELAVEHYVHAMALWQEALDAAPQPQQLSVGQLVRYDTRCFFGVVMSAFTMFDEYFLKDLGSDQAIWVGAAGGDLRRFGRKELRLVTRELLDLRLAVAQNLAAVRLKQDNLTEAVRWADAALVIEGRSPKALMRKGAALLRLNSPGPASDVLATALEVVPGDMEVKRLLKQAEARRSPSWICATGCCGPWGIVCGGPVVQTTAAVVPPKRFQDGTSSTAEPTGSICTAEDNMDDECPSCRSGTSSSSRQPSPHGAACYEFGLPQDCVQQQQNEEEKEEEEGKERHEGKQQPRLTQSGVAQTKKEDKATDLSGKTAVEAEKDNDVLYRTTKTSSVFLGSPQPWVALVAALFAGLVAVWMNGGIALPTTA